MNLALLLDMAVDGFGDRVVIGRRSAGLTAAKLREMSCVGARAIRESGADAVVYLAVNGPSFPVALFSAARAGVPLVPVNYRLGQEQMEGLLANHQKAFGIAGTPVAAAALHAAGLTTRTPEEWLELCAIGSAEEEAFVDPESPAVIIYTSGSTSAPKGVVLRHQNLFSYVTGSVEFAGAGEEEAALISVPPYHIAAVANCISNLYAGRRAMVLEQFAPDQWLELVREECVTNALVVPTMLKRLLDATGDLSVPSLRTLAYGGGPMPVPVIEHALQAWPNVGFVNAYGLTETSSTVAVLGPEDHRAAIVSDDPAVRARVSSAGRPVPSIQIQIRNEDGNELPAGVKGRIFVSGAQVSAEYLGQGPVVDSAGFFDTRDEGYVDEEGYLFIGGRADDTIIRGAENIAPAEIEQVLLRHPAITDVVVIGVPSVEWGQAIEAVIVTVRGQSLTEQEVRDYARGALRGSRTPDHVTFWNEIPRTETGKLIRRDVLDTLSASRTPESSDMFADLT